VSAVSVPFRAKYQSIPSQTSEPLPHVSTLTTAGSVSSSGAIAEYLRPFVMTVVVVVEPRWSWPVGTRPRTTIPRGRGGRKRPQPTQLHGRRSCVTTARVVRTVCPPARGVRKSNVIYIYTGLYRRVHGLLVWDTRSPTATATVESSGLSTINTFSSRRPPFSRVVPLLRTLTAVSGR